MVVDGNGYGSNMPAGYGRIEWVRCENKRLQRLFDRSKLESDRRKITDRLWSLRARLESELAIDHPAWSQKAIYRHNRSLEAPFVIYCVFSLESRQLYIGQTSGCCLKRFQEHVQTARQCGDKRVKTPLHVLMRRVGWRKFGIFPLVVFPNRTVFDQCANSYEREIIRRMHSFVPYGLNVQQGSRKRVARKRKRPMLHHVDGRRNRLPGIGPRLFGYRGWCRRADYLISLYIKNGGGERGFNAVYDLLTKYNIKNMYRVRDLLVYRGADVGDAKSVLGCIKTFIGNRNEEQPKEKNLDCSVFSVLWESTCIADIPFRNIIMSAQSKILLGVAAAFVDKVMIVRKLVKPVGNMILNYHRFVHSMKSNDVMPDPAVCPCKRFDVKYRPNDGCVRTGDLSIVGSGFLRDILSLGPKFRTFAIKDPFTSINNAVDDFIKRMSARFPLVPKTAFVAWKRYFVIACKSHLQQPKSKNYVQMNGEATRILRKLQKEFVIATVDKAAGNYSFTCKFLYRRILLDELNKQHSPYQAVAASQQEILQSHQRLLVTHSMWDSRAVFAKLPYLYFLNKFHKTPFAARFIAGSAMCSTKKLSVFVSKVLKFFLKKLKQKDDRLFRESGGNIRRFFVVSSFQAVSKFASKWKCRDRVLGSGDFSTMYTAIPHGDLKHRVMLVANEAMRIGQESLGLADIGEVFIDYNCRNGVDFRQAPRDRSANRPRRVPAAVDADDAEEKYADHAPPVSDGVRTLHRQHISLATFLECVNCLIDNIYLTVGDRIYKQTVGVPMGTNCGGDLANIYLYSYESQFIDSLLNGDDGMKEAASRFNTTFRQIDDTLSIDNPHWERYALPPISAGGIYPDWLPYNNTRKSAIETNFIGMNIKLSSSKSIVCDVFDKRDDFGFEVQRYPYMNSFIPECIPYGVFTGQLHRYYGICSEPMGFVVRCANLAIIMIQHGCTKSKLIRCFYALLFKKNKTAWKWGSKVKLKMLKRKFVLALAASP